MTPLDRCLAELEAMNPDHDEWCECDTCWAAYMAGDATRQDDEENAMGMLRIEAAGSFPRQDRTFSAMDKGHAHAVAEAIKFLSTEVLPEAIERDHRLQSEGSTPRLGFDRGGTP